MFPPCAPFLDVTSECRCERARHVGRGGVTRIKDAPASLRYSFGRGLDSGEVCCAFPSDRMCVTLSACGGRESAERHFLGRLDDVDPDEAGRRDLCRLRDDSGMFPERALTRTAACSRR
jgi:hypothetical protein